MSIDPKVLAPEVSSAAIENEIPTYRAISKLALASLLCGAASVLCFADLTFLIMVVLAIAFGLMAQARIRRMPDVLTGMSLARTGMGLALIFGLSATTVVLTQTLKLRSSASGFARYYGKVLKSGNEPYAVFMHVPGVNRKNSTPEKVHKEFVDAAKTPMNADPYFVTIKAVQNRLRVAGHAIRFVRLERYGFDRLTPQAIALFEITGKDADGHDSSEYLAAEMKSNPDSPGFDWMVDTVIYPYKPDTHEFKQAPVDDGHGHGH